MAIPCYISCTMLEDLKNSCTVGFFSGLVSFFFSFSVFSALLGFWHIALKSVFFFLLIAYCLFHFKSVLGSPLNPPKEPPTPETDQPKLLHRMFFSLT